MSFTTAQIVGIAGAVGGALMSGFAASVVPEKYHAYAFYFGLCLIGGGVLLFLVNLPFAQELAARGWPKKLSLGLGLLLFISLGWWLFAPRPAPPSKEMAMPSAEPQPQGPMEIKTVHDGRFGAGQNVKFQDLLFIFEFPGDAALGSEQVSGGHLVKGTYAWFITMQNFEKRFSYNVIHIPKEAMAENASLKVLEDLESLRGGHTRPIEREYGDERRIVGERLPYSEKIFIYHEPYLSEEQQERIWKAYKDQGHIVEFRGPEYIAGMWERHGPRGEE